MTDADEVRGLYRALLEAWNARDADAFAGLFTPDGTSIGFDGGQATGAGIVELLRPIFADHPTAAYLAKVQDIRPLGPDAAILRAIVGMVPPGGQQLNPDVNAVQSIVARRDGDGWRIALLQTTPAQYHGRPDLAEEHTAELVPLLGTGRTVD